MLTPILATKFYIPPPRPKAVLRPRLVERLNEGLHLKLTLISAPAGFGKTTLLSEWVASCERATAWLSLDEGDNDLARFLVYLVAALQTVEEGIGEGVLTMLHSSQSPPIESMLTALLNEIAAMPDDFILVLDDYHIIDVQPVDQTLAFLIEHLPPRMHVVIATREDPQIPLARLRARGQLTELRAADLRFTLTEAAEFLNRVMGLHLSGDDIVDLETRTEGWIAGLQMAALSMQGRSDTASFIQAFTGSHRFVLDYLVEEVLQRQPEHMRSFLLQTAVLDRLNGSLCDAVTGREDGRGTLETLERDNLFVIPLDDRRQWYRYHHLFADVLKTRLMEEWPGQVSALHQRASVWYEQNSMPSGAIRHALTAEDFERAAGLIELAGPMVEESSQTATWLGWVRALPDELIHARPVLSVWYAYALLGSGEMEAAEARLADAERWLEPADDVNQRPGYPAAEMVVVDENQFRSLPATIAVARAYHAQTLGDVSGTVKYAQRALDLSPEGDHLRRGQAAALLGMTYWANGDLEAANRTFADYTMNLRAIGNIPDAISTACVLAEIRMALGRLREAASTLEWLLQFVTDQSGPIPPDTADLYRGLSELYLEQGKLDAAAQHLLSSKELGEQAELPVWRYRWCIAQARLIGTQGDLDGALNWLDEAERLFIRTPLPDLHPLSAMRARIWVTQGRLAEATGWARERGLAVDDELSYLREFEHVTLARILIARYRRDRENASIYEAMRLLERLLEAAGEGGRIGSVIEILLLQALAHQAQGNLSLALTPLERALSLSEPEGYVRIFVDEGQPMAALLQETRQHGTVPNYASRLQAVFEKAEGRTPGTQLSSEPLSERELEVLELLGTEMNGPEIARTLVVSLSTLRTHTQNIYGKLGVNNRRAAVRRAEELHLL
jgi:LuxR family maltose regulon positive regulatory protein